MMYAMLLSFIPPRQTSTKLLGDLYSHQQERVEHFAFYNTINLNTAGESVNTGIIWVGGCVAGFFSGFIIDIWG
jgi:hypothetical protein